MSARVAEASLSPSIVKVKEFLPRMAPEERTRLYPLSKPTPLIWNDVLESQHTNSESAGVAVAADRFPQRTMRWQQPDELSCPVLSACRDTELFAVLVCRGGLAAGVTK